MMRRFTSVILTFLLLASVPAFGQGTRGSLSGVVADPNGAAISGASVTLKQFGTNEEFKASTNAQGAFSFPSLAPGKYSVTVEAGGFKRTELTEIAIEVAQPAKVDINLEVGAVTEQVTVTGTAQEVINTTSPTLSKTINAKQVNDLPLLTRNPLDLARLQAGLAVNGVDVRNASVQGLRGSATNVTQDGINAMDNFVKTSSFFAISNPSLNATSEFSITVGTVGSDAGRGVAQVSLVTPSGSNGLHGGVFYQHRNDALNANSFFNNATGTAKPILRQHFFGVQSSGPVWIPKLYDGRNKSFWFFSYEGFRENFNVTRNRTVLTEDARKGIFKYVNASGALQSINLLSLGNFHTLNPLTTAQLNAMPLPNNELVGDQLNTAGFRFNVLGTDPSDRYNGRFDQQLWDSQKWGSHKLEFTYHHGDFLLTPDTFNNNEAPFPGGENALQASQRVLWSVAVHSTFGAHMTNEARLGRQYAPVGFNRDNQPTRPFINLSASAASGSVSITDFDNTFMTQGRNTQLWQGVDNFSLVQGAHTFRMGVDVQSVNAISTNDAGINQTFNIGTNSNNPDGLVLGNFPNLPSGSAGTNIFNNARNIYRDLTGSLATTTKTFNITSPSSGFVEGATRSREFLYRDVSFYFQDAWKIKRNLTFNYGLRYEFLGVPTLPDGLGIQITNVNDLFGVGGPGNLFNPNSRAGNPSATLDFVSGETGKGLYKNDWNNFAPFIGFAYSPNFESGPMRLIFGSEGRSSIRAGFSITYLRDGFTTVSNALGVGTTNPGLIQTAANNTPTGVLTEAGVPLPTPAFKIPITSAENFAASTSNGLWAFDPNLRTPYVQQWSFGIEREITSNMAIEIRYAANHAIKIFRALDYNEGNIFENGFLNEFLNAQKNLSVFRTANPNCGQAGQPACTFANTGLPGQLALPTFTSLFTGVSSGNGFASTTFISNLDQNSIGAMVNTLAFQSTYRTGRGLLPPAFFVTNPNAAFARMIGNFSYSKYHSLQIELRRRFAAGLQFQANYTLAKTLNDGTGNVQSTLEEPRTLRNFGLDYQNSDQDQRHRFVANVVYDLPVGSGRRYLSGLSGALTPVRKALEGWTVGTIVTYQTSSPFYITSGRSSFNQFNSGNNSAQLGSMTFEEFKSQLGVFRTPVGIFFINPTNLTIVTGTNAAGQTVLTSARLKPGIFVQPAPGTFGNFPMNSLHGPNFTQTDFSLAKRTFFSERGNVEFRMNVFNIFNHPNFTIGNQAFDATTFGRITGTTGNSVREISFNLGVNW